MYTQLLIDKDRQDDDEMTESGSLLNKKTLRLDAKISDSNPHRCDICLEFEKFSESELIECINCQGMYHKKCQDFIHSCLHKSFLIKINKKYSPCSLLCFRCIYSEIIQVDQSSLK